MNKSSYIRWFTRAAAAMVAVCTMMTALPVETLAAYYTVGANGRSLEVLPTFTVNRSMMAPLNTPCRSGQLLTNFAGVTIHETSNWSANANALMHAKYLQGGGAGYEVSWHYCVDNNGAYQSIPEYEKAWHAGDTGKGTGNASTIAIEICDNSNGDFDQAMANAEWLAADILYRHGIYNVTGKLFQHHDFSSFGKNCPITIRDTGRWGEFVAKTQKYLDQMVAAKGTYTPILMTPTATVDQAKNWAASRKATTTFIMLADLYWELAPKSGVNPVVAYAQAAHETAFGRFGGVLDASFFNPCGMKTTAGGSNTDPNAHQRFSSWRQGVQAHIDHLALYAGQTGYPKSYSTTTPDPRHFTSLYGTSPSVEGLGGKWAPSSTYGTSVIAKMNEIQTASKDPYRLDAMITSIDVLSVDNRVMQIAITALNTGSTTWTEEFMIRLGYGIDTATNRAYLPAGVEVTSGQSYIFLVSLPITDDNPHKIVARMVQDGIAWIGAETNQEVAKLSAKILSVESPVAVLSGQRAQIAVTVENTGLVPWTYQDLFRLSLVSSDTPADRIPIPPTTVVRPGETYTFRFLTNSGEVGTSLTVNLRMVQDGVMYFGAAQTLKIPVKSSARAEITSLDMPATIRAEESFTATITVKNTDDVIWTSDDMVRLGIEGNAIGDNRVFLPAGTTVAPGESYVFTYTAKAPSDKDLSFYVQMVRDGQNWFGDKKTVLVPAYNAAITQVTAPESVIAGTTRDMTVTVMNTGTVTWTADKLFRLSTDASDTTTSRYYIANQTSVAPGESYTFTATVRSMKYPSEAKIHLQMVRDGVTFFGEKRDLSIAVTPERQAQVVSAEFVTEPVAGKNFSVKVKVKNTGSVTWTEQTLYRLGMQGNATGSDRAYLPSGTSVKPGETYEFLYTGIAPVGADLSLKFQMVQDGVMWFGEEKDLARTAYNAEFVTVSKPSSLVAGMTTNFSVTVKNTGIMPWTALDMFRLSADASDTTSNRFAIAPGVTVAPGSTYTFTVTARSMTYPSDAKFSLQMVRDGVAFFGAKSEFTIAVIPERQAQIVSSVFVSQPAAGGTFTLKVKVKNTGSVTWNENSMYRLGVVGNQTGSIRATLPTGVSVKPGQSYEFLFTAKAPTTGDLTMNLQMVQDGVTWFGDTSNVSLPALDAQIVSVVQPLQMAVSEQEVIVTMRNTGLTSWSETQMIRLATDASQTTANRWYIPSGTVVKPGETIAFHVIMAQPGSPAALHIQMVADGVRFFGPSADYSVNLLTEAEVILEPIVSPAITSTVQVESDEETAP